MSVYSIISLQDPNTQAISRNLVHKPTLQVETFMIKSMKKTITICINKISFKMIITVKVIRADMIISLKILKLEIHKTIMIISRIHQM